MKHMKISISAVIRGEGSTITKRYNIQNNAMLYFVVIAERFMLLGNIVASKSYRSGHKESVIATDSYHSSNILAFIASKSYCSDS